MNTRQNSMFALVHFTCFLLCKTAPENKYDTGLLGVDQINHSVSEVLPTRFGVAICVGSLHSQRCVEQQNTLFSPLLEVSMLRRGESFDV